MSVDVQQVTSRGCSRAYIVCVLWHGWQYVRSLRSQGEPVCFPFPDDIVQLWLDSALIDCCTAPDFLHLFGGTEFQREDASSFWTTPLNFFTWYYLSQKDIFVICFTVVILHPIVGGRTMSRENRNLAALPKTL